MRRIAVIDRNRCTGCGECYRNCPFGAIIPRGDGYEVDPSRCRGCGACEPLCPVGAISLQPAAGPGGMTPTMPPWPGMGWGRRWGRRGGWGRGRGGHGRGRRPWGGGFGPGGVGPMQPIQGDPQAELEMLRQYAEELKRRLERINRRIKELKSGR